MTPLIEDFDGNGLGFEQSTAAATVIVMHACTYGHLTATMHAPPDCLDDTSTRCRGTERCHQLALHIRGAGTLTRSRLLPLHRNDLPLLFFL